MDRDCSESGHSERDTKETIVYTLAHVVCVYVCTRVSTYVYLPTRVCV